MTPTGIIPKGIKWQILYGAGDVAVYNGLKKLFHVYPEEARIVCDILNELEDEVATLKGEAEPKIMWLEAQVEMLRQEIRNRLSDENKALARVGQLTSELARCKEDAR